MRGIEENAVFDIKKKKIERRILPKKIRMLLLRGFVILIRAATAKVRMLRTSYAIFSSSRIRSFSKLKK